MTATLTRAERKVLAFLDRYGTLGVRGSDHLDTVRALADRGLVDYDRAAGVVRRKED